MTPLDKQAIAGLREALELSAGALAVCAEESRVICFTGEWARLGRRSISEILDTANTALEQTNAD